MAKGNNLQYVLLGLLAKQDLTGYDIKKLFAQEVGDFWCARHSQVYPELRKLEESPAIPAPWAPSSRKNTTAWPLPAASGFGTG